MSTPAPLPTGGRAIPIRQLAHSSFAWVAELRRPAGPLPRLAAGPLPESFALVAAFAAEAPAGAALQLRFAPGPGGAAVDPLLVGRGRTETEALQLARLVELTLPCDVVVDHVERDDVIGHLTPFDLDLAGVDQLAELRRVTDETDSGTELIVSWGETGSLPDLTSVVGRAPADTVCCIHLERSMITDDRLERIALIVRELRDEVADGHDETTRRLLADQRLALSELRRSALSVRVVLASAVPLAPGLATIVARAVGGVDAGGRPVATELVRPINRHELDVAIQPIDDLCVGGWGLPADDQPGELRFAFTPAEAAQVFRLPPAGERAGHLAGRRRVERTPLGAQS